MTSTTISSPPLPTLPSIEKLNSHETNKENFFHVVNILFETAPPLAQRLYDSRPFSSYSKLIEKGQEIISSLSHEERIQVINAHPRIGLALPSPSAASSPSSISAFSYREQGLDKDQQLREQNEVEELRKVQQELETLNSQYEARFGFKFVVFVAGRPKSALIPVLKERLNSTKEKELQVGLEDMMDIARDRLKKLETTSKL
jgi:2-oxo-4-hydroxy-4-carboxy--5-ureidoimidazoline (OHCU) decarboxylase